MSAKPTSLPIWATDAAAQVTEPNLAKKQQGHLGGEPLFGDYENWWKNLVYRWTEYLRDGVLAGVHQFLDAVTFGALATFNAGITVAANQHITVSGTGLYKRPNRTRKASANLGHGLDAVGLPGQGNFSGTGGWTSPATIGIRFVASLQVDQGERLTSVSARVNASAADSIKLDVFRVAEDGNATIIGTANSTAAGNQTITVGGLNEPIVSDGVTYSVRLLVQTAAAQIVRGVLWSTDVP